MLAGVAADSVAAVVERMTAGSFPQQQRLRGRLSETLAGIVTRRLLPRQTGAAGRAAVYELLLADTAVRKVIREGSLEQLAAALETGRRDGMQTMDDAIYDLYMKSEISGETAIAYARDPEGMQHKLRLF